MKQIIKERTYLRDIYEYWILLYFILFYKYNQRERINGKQIIKMPIINCINILTNCLVNNRGGKLN